MARSGPEFGAAVLPHLDAAYNLALWLVRDRALAQDVVQDASVRALRHFGSFRGGDGRAWLLRIVRHAAYDAIAARDRLRACAGSGEEAEAVADPAGDPESAVAQAQLRSLLDRAIAQLPLELRECLILRELEELSYKEIAAITGAPVGTVMSRLWRARQALLGAAP